MIAWWMLQSGVSGLLIAVAAWGIESVARAAGRQVRWIWALALLLTVSLAVLMPWRTETAATSTDAVVTGVPLLRDAAAASSHTLPALIVAASRVVERIDRWMLAGLRPAIIAMRPVAVAASPWLAALWIALAAIAVIVLATVHVRFSHSRRQWPIAWLQGMRVRVSSMVGPAVMGVVRAEIVVPQWLLARDDREQSLVLEHEHEHVRVHDPLLLAVACVAVVVLPWHPAVWWMWSRLRLAVELDCDRRLLRRGISKRAYGTLLIELTGHRPASPFAVTAFACSPSHLERRLLAMTASRPRFLAPRIIAVAVLSTAGVLAACEANLPTAQEFKALDVASTEQRVGRLALVDTADVTYFVNDMPVTKEESRRVSADDIASVDVLKATNNEPTRIRVTTKKYAALRELPLKKNEGQLVGVAVMSNTFGRDTFITVRGRPMLAVQPKQAFNGLLVVDGTIVESSALERIRQEDIAGVEVIKGGAALQKYRDPRAANGVIQVTTKARAPK